MCSCLHLDKLRYTGYGVHIPRTSPPRTSTANNLHHSYFWYCVGTRPETVLFQIRIIARDMYLQVIRNSQKRARLCTDASVGARALIIPSFYSGIPKMCACRLHTKVPCIRKCRPLIIAVSFYSSNSAQNIYVVALHRGRDTTRNRAVLGFGTNSYT
jgi:hypothetical protein